MCSMLCVPFSFWGVSTLCFTDAGSLESAQHTCLFEMRCLESCKDACQTHRHVYYPLTIMDAVLPYSSCKHYLS